MRRAFLVPLALAALLVVPRARADEEPEASGLWQTHAKAFDLDGDGQITWEEYQKVTSGFAFLDSNGDGVITKDDVDAVAKKLGDGVTSAHAAMVFGDPQGHAMFALPGLRGRDAGALMHLLPWLLGGPGGRGGPWMGGMRGGFPGPWMHGPHGGFGGPWMHGPHGGSWMGGWPGGSGGPWMRGPWGSSGRHAQELLPWLPWLLHEEAEGEDDAASAPAPGAPAWAGHPTELPDGLLEMIPGPMKDLARFGIVGQRADGDGDDAISKEEWEAALRSITKDDGTLDLGALSEGVGIQGLPFPGGGEAILVMLLDADGDGRAEASDLEGVFEKADKNDDGKVTEDELLPAGTGFPFGGAR